MLTNGLLRIATFFALVAASCSAVFAQGVGTSKSYLGPTGLQLYSLRDLQSQKGTEAMLDQTKQFGFKDVEVAGTGKLSLTEFKTELDKRGLVPIASHFPYDRFRDDIAGVIKDAKTLGLKYVGCAYISHQKPFDEKQCRETAAMFNRAGAELAKHGMKFYYHNHGFEFVPYKDGTLFDLLLAETDPKTVTYEMDVMWTVFPAQDPVKLIEKYPNRFELMHLKDLKKGVPTGSLAGGTDVTNDVVLGTGQVDWVPLLKAAKKAGVKYYFIEDESPTVLEQIPQTLRFLESVNW